MSCSRRSTTHLKLPASSDERDPFAFNLPKIDLSDPELIELEA